MMKNQTISSTSSRIWRREVMRRHPRIGVRPTPKPPPGRAQACPEVAVACIDLAGGRSAEDLAEVGGYTYAWTEDDVIIVVRLGDDDWAALSAVCTHQGCFVGYRAKAGDLFCGCHASVFELDGRVTAGPAEAPLRVYTVAREGDLLVVSGTSGDRGRGGANGSAGRVAGAARRG
ncbi:MAG: Rieske (2Fe-2S) protein [Deltaproteobacteria bacterium]|nr:MAG: Rieske (2Fe-2S) protein [Deltaproteobacteria bacterium]